MINWVRIGLLLVVFSVIGVTGFYYFKSLGTSVDMGNISVKVMEKGIDVEIENFRVSHEVKGEKEWELKADLAQVNNQDDLTTLQNVEMILHKGSNKRYIILADSGTYKKKTKDVHLAGNVKFIGSSDILMERLRTKTEESSSSQ